MSSYSAIEDTIVAVSSAPGGAARGIVRLSGPQALTIAADLLDASTAQAVRNSIGFRMHSGTIEFDPLRRAPADVYVFRAPHSYTRQHIAELHTLGSPPILEMIIELCIGHGARPAEPGEFTARAYLTGAMSMGQAEAVAETIRARSDDQLRAARRMMRGEIAERIQAWSNELTDLLALVTADIDFAEEPIDFISADALAARLIELRTQLQTLRATADSRRRLDVLPYVLLLGPPNAGKSTLFNVLSGMDRAIASAVSGTTRDVLTAPIRAGGVEAILLDAAGIDDSPDEIITHGRQRALETASTVDLLCLVVDVSTGDCAQAVRRLAAAADVSRIIVANKIDRLNEAEWRPITRQLESMQLGPVHPISAVTGQGMPELRNAIKDSLGAAASQADDIGVALTTRHTTALASAEKAITRAAEHARTADSVLDVAELIAFELGEALESLGAITGQVTTEDLLGRIFSSFCIGK